MPISATGASTPRPLRESAGPRLFDRGPLPSPVRGEGEDGFTLVELLVVVVIIGLAASVVMLSAPSGRPSVAAEAEAFGARLVRAKEEAVLTNRAVGVVVGPEGYAFRVRTTGGWEPLQDKTFKNVDWGDGVLASLPERVQVNFEATGAAEPLALTLSREARRAEVSVDAAGNVKVAGS